MVSINPEGRCDGPTCNAGAVASGRLSSLLALEIEPAGRALANRDGIARADPADEHGEPALGCAAHPRRTAQAWVSVAQSTVAKYMVKRRGPSESGVEDLSAKPRSRHCRHGSVRGPDLWLQTAVWLRDCTD